MLRYSGGFTGQGSRINGALSKRKRSTRLSSERTGKAHHQCQELNDSSFLNTRGASPTGVTKNELLLKFARPQVSWISWLFEAKRRYSLRVWNYMAIPTNIHTPGRDHGRVLSSVGVLLPATRPVFSIHES